MPAKRRAHGEMRWRAGVFLQMALSQNQAGPALAIAHAVLHLTKHAAVLPALAMKMAQTPAFRNAAIAPLPRYTGVDPTRYALH